MLDRLSHRPTVLAALVVALGVGACSGGGGADESALPDPRARRVGLAVSASLADPPALPTFDDGNGHAELNPAGEYQIGVRAGQSALTATLDASFPRDQVVTAVFDSTGSPPDVGFGVVCRYEDEENYYRLGVANDGQFAIQRVRDGTAKVLTGGGLWQSNDAIRATPGPYEVRGECIGDTLTLFAGNQEVGSTRDRRIDGPRAGVFVESFAEPNSVVKVRRLDVRAFTDRDRVRELALDGWEDLLRTQQVSPECVLLDRAEAGAGRGATFVSRCADVVFVGTRTPAAGAREYRRILDEAGTTLRTVGGLPNCRRRTGVRGPLPAPSRATTPGEPAPRVGTVACLDLGDATGVVWIHSLPGVIGVSRVLKPDGGAWKDFGPDWPPFALWEAPTG